MSWMFLARAAAVGAGLFAQVIIVRQLGRHGNGLLAGATWVLAVAMLLADLGVSTSVSRALARAYYEDPRGASRIARLGLRLKLVLTVAVAGAIFALGRRFAGPELAPVVAFTALQLALDNVATFSFRGLQGLHGHGRLSIGQALSGVASPLLAVSLVWLGFGPAGAVAGRAAGAGLAAAYGLATLFALARAAAAGASTAEARSSEASVPDTGAPTTGALLRDLAGFAGQIFWVQVAYLLFFRVDRGLVQGFLGTDALGLYDPAALMAERLLIPAVSIATVAAPFFAAIGDPSRRADLRSLLARTLRSITFLYVPAAAGLAVLAPDVVRVVFGADFAATAPILRAFAAALLVLAYASLLGPILDYLGLARARAAAFAVAALADVALNAILLPRVGPVGAVVSVVVTFAPLVAFYTIALARRLAVSLRAQAKDLARAALAAAAMGAAVAAVRPERPGALALAGLVALGAATYAAGLYALGVRRPVATR
jgi:O-antigen/teichoic acid export membrane protein